MQKDCNANVSSPSVALTQTMSMSIQAQTLRSAQVYARVGNAEMVRDSIEGRKAKPFQKLPIETDTLSKRFIDLNKWSFYITIAME